MLKRQLLVTAVTFWICVLLVNLITPQVSKNSILKEEYQSDKIYWKNRFDIVVTGDSRVTIGISPLAMQKVLPGYEIGNLGFAALIYSQDYLNYVRNTLHSSARNQIIVIGFSPRSLLSEEKSRCYFRKWHNSAKISFVAELEKGSAWLHLLFHELTDKDLNNRFLQNDSRYLMVPFESGWMACRRYPEGARLYNRDYKGVFIKYKIDQRLVDLICRNTKIWTTRGIQVFGVHLPPSPSLFVIEKEFSGFDVHDVRQRFEKSGGIWLDPPLNNLAVYDGSHLRYDSAMVYSRRLAIEMKKYLDKKR
jgi:hypothetical protein